MKPELINAIAALLSAVFSGLVVWQLAHSGQQLAKSQKQLDLMAHQNRMFQAQLEEERDANAKQLRASASQIRILSEQVQEERRANLTSALLSFVLDPRRQELYDRMREALTTVDIPVSRKAGPITGDHIRIIEENNEVRGALTKYLAHYESICLAANMELIDKEVLKRLLRGRVLFITDHFGPWIKHRQQSQPRVYKELIDLAECWRLEGSSRGGDG